MSEEEKRIALSFGEKIKAAREALLHGHAAANEATRALLLVFSVDLIVYFGGRLALGSAQKLARDLPVNRGHHMANDVGSVHNYLSELFFCLASYTIPVSYFDTSSQSATKPYL